VKRRADPRSYRSRAISREHCLDSSSSAEEPPLKKKSTKTSPEPRRGRPQKFSRPSRAVTLTLPDDVIAVLRTIDTDLSRAVVRVVTPLARDAPRATAELVTFGDRAMIIVPPNPSFKKRIGVELVPLPDGRALLSFDGQLSIAEFELRLGDAIADATVRRTDKAVFQEVMDILRNARRTNRVTLQRSIILLQLA
jgi:hypothetical protein